MIKAAIFDVFGTVVDWRSGVAAVAERTFADKGLEIDPLAFADAWRGEYQPAMERIRTGERGYVPLDDLHFENLQRVLERLEATDSFDAAELWAFNSAWEQLPPWPDVVEGLGMLKRTAIIAPCSNGSIALMSRLARFGGLPWDCILGADVARAYKPSPDAYLRSAAALRLAPSEVLMVAAHNDDLAAAATLGLKTVFVARPDEHGPGGGEAEPTGEWTYVASDFPDLARQISA
ncbi:haloacid dehalogenase type II [Rhodobacteraceae bacterium NNCM2]|nr:haloacid dehalogenase type II [Coraliihabitans acroporae]